MKLRLTVSKVYDFSDKEIREEYKEWVMDYPATLDSVQEFLIDRFVAPHFDKDVEVDVQIETGGFDDNN